jgi:catechol 2,3-dioxygenase-like lactoylglutathione lyase family enzyme
MWLPGPRTTSNLIGVEMTENPKLYAKGLDHVVLTCSDMAKTVEFYHNKLGFPVLHTIEYKDPQGKLTAQHWFFGVNDPGNRNAHIAFFCFANGYQSLKNDGKLEGEKPVNPYARPVGAMMHFNLRVDAQDLRKQAERCNELGIPYRQVTRYASEKSEGHLGGILIQGMRGVTTRNEYHEPEEGWLMNSVYVIDPDGVEVEFNSWSPEWDKWPNNHAPRIGREPI